MNNVIGDIVDAWYDLLNGQVGTAVYKEDAPENTPPHYVLIRAEGGTEDNNKNCFNDDLIVIIDIITTFENNVNRSEVERFDQAICSLALPTQQSGLTNPSGVQILNVRRENFLYLTEKGAKTIFRKVSRWAHRIHQI